MGVIYVAGERPGAGSTAVAASLALAIRDAGFRVAAAKPLTLVGDDPDGEFLSNLPLGSESAGATAPPGSTQMVENGTITVDQLDQADRRVQRLARGYENVVVDGLPLVDTEGGAIGIASASLTSRLQAKVIGVTPYARSLGSAELAVWKDAFGDALAGVVINRAPLHADHDVHERLALEFDAASVPLLGVLAEERFMLAPTVRQVVDLLEGTVYAGASQDQLLIENFLIGGLVTEWGGNYFGRLPNQGVIVRGGRIDIQMAALNFPLNCLVLTGCESPPQYVYQRAEGQDVPLVVVASDTHETTTALEEIADRVNVRHLEKVTRLAGGLESALDWEAFRAAAGLG